MFFLIYVSAAVTWFSPSELRTLLERSRARNAQAGITGMLLYQDGNFMQALEGEESAVRALEACIAVDLRHRGMLTLCTGHTTERQFPDWSMAFHDLRADAAVPAGYSDFLDTPLDSEVFRRTPGRCRELLQLFRQLE